MNLSIIAACITYQAVVTGYQSHLSINIYLSWIIHIHYNLQFCEHLYQLLDLRGTEQHRSDLPHMHSLMQCLHSAKSIVININIPYSYCFITDEDLKACNLTTPIHHHRQLYHMPTRHPYLILDIHISPFCNEVLSDI